VERHQTLQATVEWSYQLLDPADRIVFDRLGVFAGAFDAAGAKDVACDDDLDEWQIVESIASLVAKSMLVVEDGPDDSTRYEMLETLRQFARERLEDDGDADRWRRRHAEHYADFAADAGAGLRGPDEVLWIARTRSELDNLRAAVDWSLDRDDPAERQLAVQIVAPFGYGTSALTAVNALGSQAASAAEHSPPELRSPVLALAAFDQILRGDPERAHELAEDALRDGIVPTAPNPLAPVQVLGLIEMTTGNAWHALELYRGAVGEIDRMGDPWVRSHHLGGLASFEGIVGEVDAARVHADAALDIARRLRNPAALANALQGKAWALQRDDPVAALDAAEQYVELHRQGLGWGGGVHAIAIAGGLRFRLGDPSGALRLLREAVLIARDTGGRTNLSAALDWSLSPLVKLDRPEPAAALIGALTHGALADVGGFPLASKTRARNLERVRALLGDAVTDELLARGATMTYDEIVEYSLEHLDAPEAVR
jgi:hypothetical protein